MKTKAVELWMQACIVLMIVVPICLFAGLLYKSTPIFENNSLTNLLFSQSWQPGENKFGFAPFIASSVIAGTIALILTIPITLLCSIYLTQYAKPVLLKIAQPVIDILSGIPSVIYGVWGILVVVPVSCWLGQTLGYQTNGYNVFSGAIVISVMIIPFSINLLIEIFNSVPSALTEASLSLGATRWQTVKFVLLKKCRNAIISTYFLGLSRALGETIAVLMVAGNIVKIPGNIFDACYPLPALLANNYGEMLSIPQYDAALMFAGLLLFILVLFFNSLSRILILKISKS